jgi:hypothetical protein
MKTTSYEGKQVSLFEELGLDFNPDAVLLYFVQNDFGMPFFIRDLSGNNGIAYSQKIGHLFAERSATPG